MQARLDVQLAQLQYEIAVGVMQLLLGITEGHQVAQARGLTFILIDLPAALSAMLS